MLYTTSENDNGRHDTRKINEIRRVTAENRQILNKNELSVQKEYYEMKEE